MIITYVVLPSNIQQDQTQMMYYNITMDAKVFDRIEKKYIITADQKKRLLKAIRSNICKDSYHKSEIYNVYFDNDNFDLIINSIDWVDFKAKIRARYYANYDYVFLEVKTKIRTTENNLGYKRRVKIGLSEYEAFSHKRQSLYEILTKENATPKSLQIAKEIDYLISQSNLSPKILIIYNRESYRDKDQVRITFDKNLRFRNQNLSFIPRKNDTMFFKDERNIIMEVKTRGALPLWLVRAMTKCDIYPERFSKIGSIYQMINQKGNHV